MLKNVSSNEIDMTLKKKSKQKSLVFKTYHRPLNNLQLIFAIEIFMLNIC
jgi:hypothetical protein